MLFAAIAQRLKPFAERPTGQQVQMLLCPFWIPDNANALAFGRLCGGPVVS